MGSDGNPMKSQTRSKVDQSALASLQFLPVTGAHESKPTTPVPGRVPVRRALW